MPIEIRRLAKGDALVDEVIELADRHRDVLGIIPRGAFPDFAHDGLILAALVERQLAGYVLYRYIKSRNEIAITHLCVERQYRGNGIAQGLVRRLSEDFPFTLGLSLKCRVDYAANAFWPKIGFVAKREMPGRSKEGVLLRLWWRNHGHPDLFSSHSGPSGDRLKIALDANVFFDLSDRSRPETESLGLLADWLIEEVDLFYTPELENEIAEGGDQVLRDSQRLLLQKMSCVSPPIQEYERVLDRINSILPPPKNDRDRADRRHLAWSIPSHVSLFISRDNLLLKICREQLENFDIEALRPSEFLTRVDRLQGEARYNPSRVAGAVSITNRKPTEIRTSEIAPLAATASGEKARELTRVLRTLLADPVNTSVRMIKEDANLLGCIGTRHQNEVSRVVTIRIRPNTAYSTTLASEMVAHCISECAERGTSFIEVQDQLAGINIEQALGEFGFAPGEHSWVKWNRRGIRTIDELFADTDRLPGPYQWLTARLRPLLKIAAKGDRDALTQIEHMLWPLKIHGIGSRNFILPIKPRWAKELFDSRYAEIDLFGCDPKLMLRRQNAYYRSASGACPQRGSRLLWYVSKNTKYPNSGAVRASAVVENASILPAREAFRKGKKFGVYNWKNVINTARERDNSVMIIFFTGIEEFAHPQPFQAVNEVLENHDQAPNHFQSIVPIAEPVFDGIYRAGMGIE